MVSEWYEFGGYFVRRDVQVGRRANGGYECELDVVGSYPTRNHLVHLEPSMDANTWAVREAPHTKKFAAGRVHIPHLFGSMALPQVIDQVAVMGFASNVNVKTLGGGRIQTTAELLAEITETLRTRTVASAAVPEQFALLRTLQFAFQHRKLAGWCA